MSSEQGSIRIRMHHPSADAVCLVGDFNHWSTTATLMHRVGGGVWEVCLARGTEVGQYGFFVFENGLPFGRLERKANVCAEGSHEREASRAAGDAGSVSGARRGCLAGIGGAGG